MASDDPVKQAVEELLEARRIADEALSEKRKDAAFHQEWEEERQNQLQNEDTNTGSGDDDGTSGESGDARSHDSEELDALETVAEAMQGEPQEFLKNAAEEVLEGDDADPHNVHCHDVFNGASGCHLTNRERLQKKLDTGGNTSFHTSYNKEDDDEAKQALKNYQNYVAIKSAMDYTQRAMEATQAYIDDLNDRQRELEAQREQIEAEQVELAEDITEKEAGVAEAQANVEVAEANADTAAENLQSANAAEEQAQAKYWEQGEATASLENETNLVYDGGFLSGTPALYAKNEDGSWTKSYQDPETGEVVVTEATAEKIESFQSNNGECDFYERGVIVENPDGTTSIAMRTSGTSVENYPLNEEQQKLFDAIEQDGTVTLDANTPTAEELDQSYQDLSDRVVEHSMAYQNLSIAEQEYNNAVEALEVSNQELANRQAELELLRERYEGNEAKLAEINAEYEANEIKLQEAQEFQQKLENNEFDNKEQMEQAMPENINVAYNNIQHTSPTTTNDYNTDFLDAPPEQMYASTYPTQPTATSYASTIDGDPDPNKLSMQPQFEVAVAGEPAKANEPTPEEPTYNPATQQPQMGIA